MPITKKWDPVNADSDPYSNSAEDEVIYTASIIGI